MKNLIIRLDNSIKEALKQLGKGGEKCLVVIGEDETFQGTLSDGDVRKAILSGKRVSESIQDIYNKNPTYFYKGQYTIEKVKDVFLKKNFDLIPVIDNEKKVINILTWVKAFENKKKRAITPLKVPVVIMAGGTGTRLEPFTNILPKSLIPINEKAIIEHIIERFTSAGCSDFHLTVNYKGQILKAYFEELQPEYDVAFVDEKEPLGTAGSLQYLNGKFDKPFFVTNCDIIIKTNYTKLYEFHQKNNYDITLVASAKEYIIPYGTCELNGDGHLAHINEKPKYDFLINTGLYVLNPDVLNFIPKDKFYHITHLIEDLKNGDKKVGVFPVDDDDWIDIGQWAEYKKAIDKF